MGFSPKPCGIHWLSAIEVQNCMVASKQAVVHHKVYCGFVNNQMCEKKSPFCAAILTGHCVSCLEEGQVLVEDRTHWS